MYNSDNSLKRQLLEITFFLFTSAISVHFTYDDASSLQLIIIVIEVKTETQPHVQTMQLKKEQRRKYKMSRQISDRRKSRKQTNKQILTLERQTRDQENKSWKWATPEGVVRRMQEKEENQEELVGDGTGEQTFLGF